MEKKNTPTNNRQLNTQVDIIEKSTQNQVLSSNDNIKIMALGGLGEVGKNCYVIEYKDDLFVIDFGVLFPDKDLLGIDYIIPNYNYLLQNKDRIKGLFITHGHEDHIGGIPFLVKTLSIPTIYAPKTAMLMIQNKFKEHGVSVPLKEIDDNSELIFGDVKIITFRQTHSIPDSLGFFIETPAGNVVTTGDFKVDFSPPGQKSADFHKMAQLAKRGVLCLLSDSTNAMTEGFSLSESSVGHNLKLLISEAPGRIIFTTFASNINRVQQIIEGALENNRKVCVVGRSLTNALAIGTKTKYISITPKDLVDARDASNYKDEELVIITTGSQGESLAALSRIANGTHTHLSISSEDTVVFASNPIPGNNYQIGKVIDALSKTDCNIITNSDVFKTHASGHASKEEQKLLLTLWQPKYFAPIHGTHYMLLNHKKSAMQIGIPENNIFILDNGDILNMNINKPFITKNAFLGNSIYVSGNNINVSTKSGIMEQLASDGLFVITAIYDKNKNLISYPYTITRGLLIINESIDIIQESQSKFIEAYHKHKNLPAYQSEKKISEMLSIYFKEKINKDPLIKVKLIAYNPMDIKEKNTSQ